MQTFLLMRNSPEMIHGLSNASVRYQVAMSDRPGKLIERLVADKKYPRTHGEGYWLGGRAGDGEPAELILTPEQLQGVVQRERDHIAQREQTAATQATTTPQEDAAYESFTDAIARKNREHREWEKQHPYRTFWHNVSNRVRWWAADWTLRDIRLRYLKVTQRARRGWSDQDVWSADVYLSTIIPDMLEKLREWRTGLPLKSIDEMTIADWQDELVNQRMGIAFTEEEWWNDIVLRIILAFRRWKAVYHEDIGNWLNLTEEERHWVDEEFREAGKLFFQHFGNFWD